MTNPNPADLPQEVVVPTPEVVPGVAPGEVVATTTVAVPVVPTQVANPSRASWRTALFSILAMLPIVNLSLVSLQGILADAGITEATLPAWFWLALNGAVLVTGVVAKWINSIALMPQVNDWITEHLPKLAPAPVTPKDADGDVDPEFPVAD